MTWNSHNLPLIIQIRFVRSQLREESRLRRRLNGSPNQSAKTAPPFAAKRDKQKIHFYWNCIVVFLDLVQFLAGTTEFFELKFFTSMTGVLPLSDWMFWAPIRRWKVPIIFPTHFGIETPNSIVPANWTVWPVPDDPWKIVTPIQGLINRFALWRTPLYGTQSSFHEYQIVTFAPSPKLQKFHPSLWLRMFFASGVDRVSRKTPPRPTKYPDFHNNDLLWMKRCPKTKTWNKTHHF